VEKTKRDLPFFMPKKRLTEAQRSQFLEDTKQRIRLEQEARTKARPEELEIEVLENLGRQLRLEHLELSGELECPETGTARQYPLVTSDDEEDLTDEKTSSSVIKSEIETPD
jgi:hypothetical protein